jgi:hypothetical protein
MHCFASVVAVLPSVQAPTIGSTLTRWCKVRRCEDDLVPDDEGFPTWRLPHPESEPAQFEICQPLLDIGILGSGRLCSC